MIVSAAVEEWDRCWEEFSDSDESAPSPISKSGARVSSVEDRSKGISQASRQQSDSRTITEPTRTGGDKGVQREKQGLGPEVPEEGSSQQGYSMTFRMTPALTQESKGDSAARVGSVAEEALPLLQPSGDGHGLRDTESKPSSAWPEFRQDRTHQPAAQLKQQQTTEQPGYELRRRKNKSKGRNKVGPGHQAFNPSTDGGAIQDQAHTGEKKLGIGGTDESSFANSPGEVKPAPDATETGLKQHSDEGVELMTIRSNGSSEECGLASTSDKGASAADCDSVISFLNTRGAPTSMTCGSSSSTSSFTVVNIGSTFRGALSADVEQGAAGADLGPRPGELDDATVQALAEVACVDEDGLESILGMSDSVRRQQVYPMTAFREINLGKAGSYGSETSKKMGIDGVSHNGRVDTGSSSAGKGASGGAGPRGGLRGPAGAHGLARNSGQQLMSGSPSPGLNFFQPPGHQMFSQGWPMLSMHGSRSTQHGFVRGVPPHMQFQHGGMASAPSHSSSDGFEKCEKCDKTFMSSVNHRRHIRLHRKLGSTEKEDLRSIREPLAEFLSKLGRAKIAELLLNPCLPENSQWWAQQQQLESMLPLAYLQQRLDGVLDTSYPFPLYAGDFPIQMVHLGRTLQAFLQGPSMSVAASWGVAQLFEALDGASEGAFLVGGTSPAVQRFAFQGQGQGFEKDREVERSLSSGQGKQEPLLLEKREVLAALAFVAEHRLVSAFMVEREAAALQRQQLLVEEEEAAAAAAKAKQGNGKKKSRRAGETSGALADKNSEGVSKGKNKRKSGKVLRSGGVYAEVSSETGVTALAVSRETDSAEPELLEIKIVRPEDNSPDALRDGEMSSAATPAAAQVPTVSAPVPAGATGDSSSDGCLSAESIDSPKSAQVHPMASLHLIHSAEQASVFEKAGAKAQGGRVSTSTSEDAQGSVKDSNQLACNDVPREQQDQSIDPKRQPPPVHSATTEQQRTQQHQTPSDRVGGSQASQQYQQQQHRGGRRPMQQRVVRAWQPVQTKGPAMGGGGPQGQQKERLAGHMGAPGKENEADGKQGAHIDDSVGKLQETGRVAMVHGDGELDSSKVQGTVETVVVLDQEVVKTQSRASDLATVSTGGSTDGLSLTTELHGSSKRIVDEDEGGLLIGSFLIPLECALTGTKLLSNAGKEGKAGGHSGISGRHSCPPENDAMKGKPMKSVPTRGPKTEAKTEENIELQVKDGVFAAGVAGDSTVKEYSSGEVVSKQRDSESGDALAAAQSAYQRSEHHIVTSLDIREAAAYLRKRWVEISQQQGIVWVTCGPT